MSEVALQESLTAQGQAPKLIGLTGYAQSGKDAVSAFLRMVGYKRFGFADAVREEVAVAQKHNRFPTPLPDLILADWITMVDPWEKPTSPNTRRVLQWWGTEYRRAQDPLYWIKQLETRLAYEPSKVVITDLRFLNEADFVERHDGVIWRVDRPGVERMDHVSETELDSIIPDRIINNNGDLQNLARQVLAALEAPYAITA